MVGLVISYRLAPSVKHPEQVRDVASESHGGQGRPPGKGRGKGGGWAGFGSRRDVSDWSRNAGQAPNGMEASMHERVVSWPASGCLRVRGGVIRRRSRRLGRCSLSLTREAVP